MTTQEAYESIRAYFSRPRAVLFKSPNGNCFYRKETGSKSVVKCAVGCLIPKSQYKASFENRAIAEIYSKIPALDGIDVYFLEGVQNKHDSSSDTATDFVSQLDDLASIYHLKVVCSAT